MTEPVPGNPGQPGEPGEPAPVSKGGAGGAGGAGGVGLPGPKGDHGDPGPVGFVGLPGGRGARGDQGLTGVAGPAGANGTTSRVSRILWAITALCIAAIVVLALVITAGSQQSLDRVRARLVQIEDNQSATADADAAATDRLIADRKQEQDIEDCFNLYRNDVAEAQAAYLSEFGDLFSTIVELPPANGDAAVTEENRQVISRAVRDLATKNTDYQAAITAYDDYTAIVPAPTDCPHP